MKRIIALILAIVITITSLLSLSGCSATTENSALLMGQWLTLISDSFGMQNYNEEKPYFEKVNTSNSDFAVFQMAVEWNIIEPDNNLSSTTPVKWNDALITLVNAGGFLSEDTSDKEKIKWAIENFDNNIRDYWGNRYIKMKEAVPILDKAQQLWTKKEFTEKVEKVSFNNSVNDNTKDTSLKYNTNGNSVVVDDLSLSDLKPGDVYTLPASDSKSPTINKVKSISTENGKTIIENDENFSEEDALEYIEEVKIQETSSPDFTKIEGIYDEFGNPIKLENGNDTSGVSLSETPKVVPLGCSTQNNLETTQVGLFDNVKGSLKFKVDKYSVSLGLTKDDVSVELSKEISKTSNRYREKTQKVYGGVKFTGVRLTKDIDYSWGQLHSATVKLDYKTTISAGLKQEKKNEIGNPIKDGENTVKSISSVINQYKSTLSSLKSDVKSSKCDDDIYICRIALAEGGLASVDFIVKGKVTAEGELKITFEIEGSQGLEYKNGNLRYIKSKGVDCDFAAEGKIEVTIGPGIALTILKKIAVIELVIDTGLGVSWGLKCHLFDAEGHELYSGDAQISANDANALSDAKQYTTADEILAFAKSQGGDWNNYEQEKDNNIEIIKGVCADWKLYPIVKIGIDGKSLVGKLAKKFGVSVSVEVLGSKNTILQGHIDFPSTFVNAFNSDSVGKGLSTLLGIGAECSYDYKPWDNTIDRAEELDPTTENDSISVTDTITLSTMRVFVVEGGTEQISVAGLPKGYELKDVEAYSEDKDIATFDIKEGKIKGIKEGTTQIIVKTKDEKHKQYCAVTVTSNKKVDFNKIPDKKTGVV